MSTQIQIKPETGITIGTTPISSGTDGRILFQSGGVVQQSARMTFDGNTYVYDGGTATANISIFEVKGGGGQRSFRAYQDNSVQVGGNTNNFITKGTGTGQVTNNFYSADSHWCFGGAVGYGRVHIGALSQNPQAVLDVRAQGALSTDIAFRVRNSANTLDSFYVNGLGQGGIKSNSYTPRFAVSYDWAGGHRDAFVFTQNIQNFRGQTWTFDAGYNGNAERLIISNDLTSNEQGYFSICQNNFNFGKTYHPAETSSERRVLRIYNGVAPSARTIAETDFFKMYSADISAGNAAPHFETENGAVIKLYQQSSAGIATVADIVTVLQNLGFLS